MFKIKVTSKTKVSHTYCGGCLGQASYFDTVSKAVDYARELQKDLDNNDIVIEQIFTIKRLFSKPKYHIIDFSDIIK